jgi:transglutaminase-like putative cysteine protease
MQTLPSPPAGGAAGAEFLASGEFIDSATPAVRAFSAAAIGGAKGEREQAVRLYYAVRDGFRYDPYSIRAARRIFVASDVLAVQAAFCIPKAILLAAAARAAGIPAGIGLADVKNHLTTRKLRALMGTDIFIHHGYTVLWLDGRWVKCTPAFNIELCQKFGVLPLEFDGEHDSLMHPYDANRQRHMEYLQDHGIFADFPYDRVIGDFLKLYPGVFKQQVTGRFEQETPLRP